MAVRVFLSFIGEDLARVNLFRGQARLESSNLEYHDYSIKEPFDSYNAQYIQRGIAGQIKLATLTVCLYGRTTYEQMGGLGTDKALEIGKPLMGVSLYSDKRVRYCPAPLEPWLRSGRNIRQIVETMNHLAAQYRGAREVVIS